jgi:hypothetical protein
MTTPDDEPPAQLCWSADALGLDPAGLVQLADVLADGRPF